MTTKKATPDTPEVPEEELQEGPTAEEIREAELEAEELLADLPALTPAHRLRPRHKTRLLKIAAQASVTFRRGNTSRSLLGNVDYLDIVTEIDEFAESIALDPDAYAEWSIEHADDYDAFLAIMNRYSVSLGESKRSTN